MKLRKGIVYEGNDGTRSRVTEPVLRGMINNSVMAGSPCVCAGMDVGLLEGVGFRMPVFCSADGQVYMGVVMLAFGEMVIYHRA